MTRAAMTMPNYAPPAVTFVRGSGTRLWDDQGKEYLDFLTGLAVVSLGHANPVIAAATAKQAAKLVHVSNIFGNEHNQPLAAAIDRLIGGGGQVFFANSGTEAVECALKLARKHGGRGRHVVVSAYGSFHGRTLAALAATGQPDKHEPFAPMPEGFRHVAFDDIDALISAMDPSVAAVLIETVQGEGGVNPAGLDYLRAVRKLCDERGALLIVDEIQTGLARTGRWFGFQHADIEPDVVTLAKALGNGFPIGACWARAEVAATFGPGDHGSTFGGQPLAAATARAVVAELERIDAPALAQRAGARLRAGLQTIPAITSVRGRGLLLAAELREGIEAKLVAAACLEAGLIVNAVRPTSVRFAPPLTVSDDEIDTALAIVAEALR
ncbi:MAG: aspartate aminotransferase family protein [Acidimicrobiales bacterium]